MSAESLTKPVVINADDRCRQESMEVAKVMRADAEDPITLPSAVASRL